MEENVAEIAHRPLPDLTLPGTDGQDHNLGLIAADNPLVLVFIKEGCPCSLGAQPWFNQLFDAHGADARFFGIIDADLEQGKDWARKSPTPFPLLCDKSGSLMRAWNINSGGQLALIAKGGTIERLWPGFSNENLHSANQAIAQLRNVAPPTIDFEYAPRREITGCPYDFQTEAEPKP
jgi:peroxiredoxin